MSKNVWEGLNLAGVRYWIASLLPACVGTTLPIWLRPPNFTFRFFAAIEFLVATVILHAGFAFLWNWFKGGPTENWSRKSILLSAGLCLSLACLMGLHLDRHLTLQAHVYESVFLVYGICVLFVGALYVAPPVSFYRRVGGEIVLTYSLGLLPVLGAYLVQVGDLTRRVYLVALPVIVILGLWVWLTEITAYLNAEETERKTLVAYLGIRNARRVGILTIVLLYLLTILLAVFSAAVNPLVLVTLLFLVPMGKIVTQIWNDDPSFERMRDFSRTAIFLHGATCLIIALSSLFTGISSPFPVLSW